MRKSLFTAVAVGLAVVLAVFWTAEASAKPKGPTTIKVNCNKHQSIQEALGDDSPQLVVEITGVCSEYVTITRDNVTLRGVGGAVLDGTSLPTPKQAGISVIGASNVAFENLTVQGMFTGIRLDGGAGATLTGVVLQDNATGLDVMDSSSALLTDCTAQRNTYLGISAWQSSSLFVVSGTVAASNNGLAGLVLSGSSINMSKQTRIEANNNAGDGISIQVAASALLYNANVSVATNGNSGAGISLYSNSSMTVAGLESTGNYWGVLADGAYIDLVKATITGSGDAGVFADDAATVTLSGTSTVSDNTGSGIAISQNSFLSLLSTTIQGNGQSGLFVDGGVARIQRLTATGNTGADVALSFGARVDFSGTNTFGTAACDQPVLTRGWTCPGVLASAPSLMQMGPERTSPGSRRPFLLHEPVQREVPERAP
jgi:hypothetical protein